MKRTKTVNELEEIAYGLIELFGAETAIRFAQEFMKQQKNLPFDVRWNNTRLLLAI